MTTSKFWDDIQAAYRQVAANNERSISVSSNAEGLTALVGAFESNMGNGVSITIVPTPLKVVN